MILQKCYMVFSLNNLTFWEIDDPCNTAIPAYLIDSVFYLQITLKAQFQVTYKRISYQQMQPDEDGLLVAAKAFFVNITDEDRTFLTLTGIKITKVDRLMYIKAYKQTYLDGVGIL